MNFDADVSDRLPAPVAHDLSRLGLEGRDVYLAELLPLVEMAWADGEITANERALLEAFCESLTERLNRERGGPSFKLARNLLVLERLMERRLDPTERFLALTALRDGIGAGPRGAEVRLRVLCWAEVIAAVDGGPEWDPREVYWLELMQRTFNAAA